MMFPMTIRFRSLREFRKATRPSAVQHPARSHGRLPRVAASGSRSRAPDVTTEVRPCLTEPVLLPITPVPKPRMTRRDRWKKRPVVLAYRAFRDAFVLGLKGRRLPDRFEIVFLFPMPKSWSKEERAKRRGTPHQDEKDVDNTTKSVLDAFAEPDGRHWDVRAIKLWADEGGVLIVPIAADREFLSQPSALELLRDVIYNR